MTLSDHRGNVPRVIDRKPEIARWQELRAQAVVIDLRRRRIERHLGLFLASVAGTGVGGLMLLFLEQLR